MAILAIFEGEGITKQMYEIIRKEVNWEHKRPTGGMFHVAAFDDSGNTIHVVDVWESEEDLNNFFNNKVKPVMEKVKSPQPKLEIFQVNDISAYPGIDRYKV